MDKAFNKDGSVSKGAQWALDEEALNRLADAAVGKAADLCDRIRDGEIDAAPSADGQLMPCRYCEYGGFCRTRREDRRSLDREMTFRDIARAEAEEQGKNTLHENEK